MPRPPTLDDGMRGREGWKERSGGRERWGMTKERARGRLSQQKERKATQMLAIVLGEQGEGNYGAVDLTFRRSTAERRD